MNINCVIIEDEPLAQQRLKSYIQKLPYLHLLAAFDNGPDALEFMKVNATDVVFLDINLGLLSGMQLLELRLLPYHIIITTAYGQFALKGYELNVDDYLLKPFTFERFLQAVTKVQHMITKTVAPNEPQFIFVKTAYRLEKIYLSEILYIEGMRDYRKIYYGGHELTTLKTFGEFVKEIPDKLLCRVHRSYMVSLHNIDLVERDHIKIGSRLIPISDTYKKRFFELIKS